MLVTKLIWNQVIWVYGTWYKTTATRWAARSTENAPIRHLLIILPEQRVQRDNMAALQTQSVKRASTTALPNIHSTNARNRWLLKALWHRTTTMWNLSRDVFCTRFVSWSPPKQEMRSLGSTLLLHAKYHYDIKECRRIPWIYLVKFLPRTYTLFIKTCTLRFQIFK